MPAFLFGGLVLVQAADVESSERPHLEDEAEIHDETSLEAIWSRFVQHLEASGHEDLIPASAFAEEEDSESHEGHDHFAEGAHAGHDHGEVVLPDLQKGDPVRGILFKLSKDLVVLDAWFEDAELAAKKGERRDRKIAEMIARLEATGDPWLASYGRSYAARQALEQKDVAKARELLESLVESKHFLDRANARRVLATAYREVGEETRAILELQFLLAEASPDATSDRVWAEGQLAEIRENHDGPLHDCADRARSIGSLISVRRVDGETQGQQEDVEDILTKIADLLEDQANRCPSCQQPVSQKTGQCKSSCSKCGECKAGQLAGAKPGQKPGSKPGQKPGQKPGSKPCPNGECPGEGELAKKPGEPKGAKPSDSPAEDTKLADGKSKDPALRDRQLADQEAWGRINDRKVQASLREMWSKMPGHYRNLVSQYFSDLSDVE